MASYGETKSDEIKCETNVEIMLIDVSNSITRLEGLRSRLAEVTEYEPKSYIDGGNSSVILADQLLSVNIRLQNVCNNIEESIELIEAKMGCIKLK